MQSNTYLEQQVPLFRSLLARQAQAGISREHFGFGQAGRWWVCGSAFVFGLRFWCVLFGGGGDIQFKRVHPFYIFPHLNKKYLPFDIPERLHENIIYLTYSFFVMVQM